MEKTKQLSRMCHVNVEDFFFAQLLEIFSTFQIFNVNIGSLRHDKHYLLINNLINFIFKLFRNLR